MKNPFNKLLKKETSSDHQNDMNWLNELSTLNVTDRLKPCIMHVTTMLNNSQLTADQKINFIFKVDDFNYDASTTQLTSFAKAENLKSDIADQIMINHYAYERIMFLAYSKLIDSTFNQAEHLQPDNETKAILLIRTVLIATKMLKWRYFDYSSAPIQLWQQVNNLYKKAEQNLITKFKIKPYSDFQETNFENTYLSLLLLGSINHNCLVKSQVEFISSLISYLLPEVRIKTSQLPFHSFYVDLDKDKPAERVRVKKPTGDCLFWDLDEAEHKVENAISELKTLKTSQLLVSVGIKPNLTHLDTLKFLQNEWSKTEYKRQRRKESRQKNHKNITVTFSIDEVIDLVKQRPSSSKTARGLLDGTLSDRRLSSSLVMRGTTNTLYIGNEKWQIEDESKLGFGSINQNNIKLKPNKIIGILNEDKTANVAIGIIRNTKQLTGGKVKTGIEILSDKPCLTSAKIFETKKEQESKKNQFIEKQSNSFNVIYVPENLLSGLPASLIVPKSNYIASSFYELNYKNNHEIVKLNEIIEFGDDWIRVAFPEALN